MAKPIMTLDFEASALQLGSFPIEVGIAIGNGEKIIQTFTTLIQPRPEWLDHGVWSKQSEAVHGIKASQLARGMPAIEVCSALDRLLYGSAVYVDGGYFDAYWLFRLYGGKSPKFRLVDLDVIPYRELRKKRADEPADHRALPDAKWLHDALVEIERERMAA